MFLRLYFMYKAKKIRQKSSQKLQLYFWKLRLLVNSEGKITIGNEKVNKNEKGKGFKKIKFELFRWYLNQLNRKVKMWKRSEGKKKKTFFSLRGSNVSNYQMIF